AHRDPRRRSARSASRVLTTAGRAGPPRVGRHTSPLTGFPNPATAPLMRTIDLGAALFVCALPCLTGCPAAAPPRSQFPTANDAIARMKATYACVNGVQGDAKIDVFSKEVGRIRGEMLLLAVNPDRVRFD